MSRVESVRRRSERVEKEIAKVMLEILEALLEGRISREETAKAYLKLFTEAPVSNMLEDILATLILVDEPIENGGPSREELERIREELKRLTGLNP